MDVVIDIPIEPVGTTGSERPNRCRTVFDIERGDARVVHGRSRMHWRALIEFVVILMVSVITWKLRLSRGPVLLLVAVIGWCAVMVIVITRCVEVFSHLREILYYLRDLILYHTGVHRDCQQLRRDFRQTAVITREAREGKVHGDSAALRASARDFVSSFCSRTGRIEFKYQYGAGEDDRRGQRRYFWARDGNIAPQLHHPRDNDLVTMVDVDYYEDMPKYLTTFANPIVLYSFVPSAVSRPASNEREGDYAYTFNARNEVVMHIAGGAHYAHQLWDYGADIMSAQRRLFGLIPWAYTTYSVERINLTQDRQIIGLFPQSTWKGLSALLAWALPAQRLSRLEPVQGDFLRLNVMQTDAEGTVKHFTSTGEVGSFSCVTIPVHVDETVRRVAEISKSEIVSPQVQSFIDGDKHGGALLTKYHRSTTKRHAQTVFPSFLAVRNYQFVASGFDWDAKSSVTAFMSPLVHEGFAPQRSNANDRIAVLGRIKEVESSARPNRFHEMCMDEFIALSRKAFGLRDGEFLQPSTFEEVCEQQKTPTQRRILHLAATTGEWWRNAYATFMKREVYSNVKDPRIITTFPEAEKLRRSYYSYPLAAACKAMPWYGFGADPREISARVARLCVNAERHVVKTDYKRWDGHVSPAIAEFERRMMLAFYAPCEHAEILASLDAAQKGEAYFQPNVDDGLGLVKYRSPFTRKSGCPFTSVWNTKDNAFIAYTTLRRTKVDGVYLTPAEAWRRLGIYGGDDGLTPDVDPVLYTKTAASFGQVLEQSVVKRGECYVEFLSRIYGPYVWEGDPNNCCDLRRQLGKVHISATMPANITPLEKYADKIRGFKLSDANTPVIGHLVRLFERLVEPQRELPQQFAKKLIKWTNGPFHNERADWMFDYMSSSMPDFNYDQFLDWYGDTYSLERGAGGQALLHMPLCCEPIEPKAARPAVVGDDVCGPVSRPENDAGAGGKRPTRRGPRGVKKQKRL